MASGGRHGDNARQLNVNLRQSVSASRSLTFAIGDMSGKLGGAVNAAGHLAENIAKAAGASKSIALAWGAAAAVLGSVVAGVVNWKSETKEIADKVAAVRRDIGIINAKGAGDARQQSELEIADAMERELVTAKGLEHFYRKFPALQDAIRDKALAANRALAQEASRAASDRYSDLTTGGLGPWRGGTAEQRERFARTRDIQKQYDDQFRDLLRNKEGFSPEDQQRIGEALIDSFENSKAEMEYDLAGPSRELGDSLGRSITGGIADGIATAVSTGSFSDGFKAMTGGILIGLGTMMQEIGTRSLLAAQLMQSIIAALESFAPAGAIGPSLLLIATGAALKGLGASMGGRSRGGGGSGGGGGGGYGSSAVPPLIYSLNPTRPLPMSGLAPKQSINVHATFIGQRDPRAGRELLEMIKIAQVRGAP